MTNARLGELVRLAQMMRDADLARLQTARALRDAERARRDALDRARRAAIQAATDATDIGGRANAAAYATWLALRQEDAVLSEARAAASLAARRAEAARSLGRSEAATELAARAQADRHRDRARRIEEQSGKG